MLMSSVQPVAMRSAVFCFVSIFTTFVVKAMRRYGGGIFEYWYRFVCCEYFFYTIMPCIASMCTPVCVLSTNVIVFRSVTVTEKVITVKSINITAVISF